MTTYTYSQTRQNLKSVFDEACDDATAVKVKRRNGQSVIIVSANEYESLIETLQLLSTKANRHDLEQAQTEYDNGEFIRFNSLADLKHAVGHSA